MAWFRRTKASGPAAADAATEPQDDAQAQVEAADEAATLDPDAPVPTDAFIDESKLGPWDSNQVPGKGEFLRLGALWLPVIQGLTISFEMDPTQTQVTAARVMIGDSALQLQAFAAPKSSGIWDEIRAELAESITGGGGSVQERTGPLGTELLTQVATADASGRPATASMLFIGVDGPRWFLRGVISGPAATDEQAATPLRDLMRVVVVDRGEAPMAPRELLELRLPEDLPQDQEEPGEQRSARDLDPFTRGPEITEIR